MSFLIKGTRTPSSDISQGFCVLVVQSCLTFCESMDCSPPGSSVRENFQARILEWVAIPFSRGSSQPRDHIWVSHIAGRLFTLSHQGICSKLGQGKYKMNLEHFMGTEIRKCLKNDRAISKRHRSQLNKLQ